MKNRSTSKASENDQDQNGHSIGDNSLSVFLLAPREKSKLQNASILVLSCEDKNKTAAPSTTDAVKCTKVI